MSAPIKTYSCGKCQAAIFQNDQYKTFSVKFQKNYMDKNKQWKQSEYFSLPDLRDMYCLIGKMLDNQVKEKTLTQPATQPAPQPAAKPEADTSFDFGPNEEVAF